MRSWEELTVVEQLQSNYSDFFKDVHGFRPRFMSTEQWNSEEWLRDATNDLLLEQHLAKQEEARRIAAANLEVEKSIEFLIAVGAKDRKTAVRWLLDSMNAVDDPDYACHKLGIEYGYFDKDL